MTCDICTEHNICVRKEIEVEVTPRNVNEEELRAAVKEIDALYAEKNCLEAISLSRMLIATLRDSPDGSNWNKLRNGGCGAFFRATKVCMNDLQTRQIAESLFKGIYDNFEISIPKQDLYRESTMSNM